MRVRKRETGRNSQQCLWRGGNADWEKEERGRKKRKKKKTRTTVCAHTIFAFEQE